MARIIFSLLLIAGIAGTVSNHASVAVPGNFLYPFKTGVNESLGRLFSATYESKAVYAAELAHERLLELQTLTQEAALSAETEARLMRCFDAEVDSFKAALDLMQTNYDNKTALAIVKGFQNTLGNHIAVLTALRSDSVPHLQQTLDSLSELNSTLSQNIIQ